jgi:superfamily II DNA or RNA helicase
MLDLRPYQRRALDNVATAEREGVRRPLIVHPTGTGKTVTFTHGIAERAERGRSAVLVHREELAEQTRKKIQMVAPELSVGTVKAELNELDADVVVVSVPTVARTARLAQLVESGRRSPFGTLWVDEAHHAPAPSWTRALTDLGSFNPYGPLTVGFTATPERDNKTLGVWEKVVDFMSIREAIYGDPRKKEEGGYLVPILPAVVVETSVDLDKVGRSRGGDYSDGGLGAALEESGAIAQMADAVKENAPDRKGVAFLPTVRTSQLLAEALRARGIAAEHLDGATPADERRAILRRLKTGETQWVCNCAVLTEGFDEPSISCVLIGRPTKFHGLYVQMVGRGTRLFPGKKDLMVIDIVGASERHELIGLVDLGLDIDDPRKPKDPGEEPEAQACPSCGVPCEFAEHRCVLCHRYLPAEIALSGGTRHENCKSGGAKKVDVFGSSRLRWLPVEDGFCLGAGKEVVVMVPVGIDTWKLAAYEGGKLTVLQDELPADWAMGIGEDRAKAFTKLVERQARWLRAPVTEAQLQRLVREGLPSKHIPRVKTKGEAADLITRIAGRRAVRRLRG